MFARVLVLYGQRGPLADGVVFADGQVALNNDGKIEIYPSVERLEEAYRTESGFKIVVQARG